MDSYENKGIVCDRFDKYYKSLREKQYMGGVNFKCSKKGMEEQGTCIENTFCIVNLLIGGTKIQLSPASEVDWSCFVGMDNEKRVLIECDLKTIKHQLTCGWESKESPFVLLAEFFTPSQILLVYIDSEKKLEPITMQQPFYASYGSGRTSIHTLYKALRKSYGFEEVGDGEE